jgi:hypothetical protein
MSNVISLDTETTGLRPSNKSVLWSGAFSRSNNSGSEFFIKNRMPINEMLEDASKNSIFQKKQIARGAYKNYAEAAKQGKLVSEKRFLKTLSGELANSPKVLLMQNANFENTFISDMADRNNKGTRLQSLMEFRTKDGGKYLYSPPSITNQRNKIRDLHRDMFNASGFKAETNPESYYEANRQLMSEYSKIFNDPNRKGTVVAELMDFTKGMYSAAARHGHISKDALGARATNIEYLSQVLLGEKEQHTALSDAKQQMRLFNRILDMHNEIESGSISRQTVKDLQLLNKTLPHTKQTSMYSAAVNAIEEFKNSPTQTYSEFNIHTYRDTVEREVLSKSYGKQNIKVPKYSKAEYLRNPKDILDAVEARYGSKIDENLKSGSSIDEIINGLYERTSKEKEKLSNLIDEIRSTTKKTFKPELTKKTAIGLGIAAALTIGTTAALLSNKKEEEPEKEKKTLSNKIKKQKNTPEAIFKSFSYNSNPVTYNGTGFYNWENRIGHHEA